jgi:hypothetical protein
MPSRLIAATIAVLLGVALAVCAPDLGTIVSHHPSVTLAVAAVLPRLDSDRLVKRLWSRLELAEFWRVSDRTIDRMRRDGRLGQPLYPGGGRWPRWTNEQRLAAEQAERDHPYAA